MRLEEILQTTIKPLSEAMRMTSEMKRIADSSAGEFRFGIEYEFHVYSENIEDMEDSNETGSIPDQAYADAMSDLEVYFSNFARALETINENIPREWFAELTNSSYEQIVNGGFLQEEFESKLFNLLEAFIDANRNNQPRIYMNVALSNLPYSIKTASMIDFERIEDFTYNKAPEIMNVLKNSTIEELADIVELHEVSINQVIEQVYENGIDNLNHEQITERLTEDIMDQAGDNEGVEEYVRSFISDEDDDEDDDQKRINFIEQKIANAGIDQHIDIVVLDRSVDDGVEVVTKPLPLQETVQVMSKIFDMIEDYGYTTRQTGMHVNISHSSFAQGQTPDPLKIAALMDIEYFQGQSNGGIVKYGIRNHMVQSTFETLNTFTLERFANAYIDGGIQEVEGELRNEVIGSNKYRDINWTSLLQNFDAGDRRIEFRFFGGGGYELRKNEILNDLKYIMAVVKVVSDDQYKPRDYYRGIIKILDRAVKRRVNAYGNHPDFGNPYDGQVNDFGSLIRFMKKARS